MKSSKEMSGREWVRETLLARKNHLEEEIAAMLDGGLNLDLLPIYRRELKRVKELLDGFPKGAA